jgi:transposase InsO family protein
MNMGRDKLFSVLRANHLLIKPKRNYRITTDSRHRIKKHESLMEGMQLNRPELVRVSDITYIGGRKRNCYLALVTDAYSKKIMGYDVSESPSTEGTLRALNMAVRKRRNYTPLIHPSDRGIRYCSNDYQHVLKSKK